MTEKRNSPIEKSKWKNVQIEEHNKLFNFKECTQFIPTHIFYKVI